MNPPEIPTHPLQNLYDSLLQAFPAEAGLKGVEVGLHWTMVTLEFDGVIAAGLASTLSADQPHGESVDVHAAGELIRLSALEVAQLIGSASPTERSLGLAAINASLSFRRQYPGEQDALELLRLKGKGKRIGLVGHFPFIPKLERVAEQLLVFEIEPLAGEHPAEAAAELLPSCQVIAITSMSLLNGSFTDLIAHTQSAEFVMLLGPSTPLSPLLFEYGLDCLAGTLVENVPAVASAVRQGGNYRQIHQIGTKLVALHSANRSQRLEAMPGERT